MIIRGRVQNNTSKTYQIWPVYLDQNIDQNQDDEDDHEDTNWKGSRPLLSGPIRALRIAPSQRSLPDDASSSSASSSWTNVFLAVKIIQQKCTFLAESLSELTVEKSKLGQCWGLIHVHLQEAVHFVQTPDFSECQYLISRYLIQELIRQKKQKTFRIARFSLQKLSG